MVEAFLLDTSTALSRRKPGPTLDATSAYLLSLGDPPGSRYQRREMESWVPAFAGKRERFSIELMGRAFAQHEVPSRRITL